MSILRMHLRRSTLEHANSLACGNEIQEMLGVKNVMDQPPPFVAASLENGYDEATANISGRMWYVALKKRF